MAKRIKLSNYYSLVNKATDIIIEKGSKRTLVKMIKNNPGRFYLAITSKPIGEKFPRQWDIVETTILVEN